QPRDAAEAPDRRGAGAPAGGDRGGRADGGAGPEGGSADQGSVAGVRGPGRDGVPVHAHAGGRGGAVRPDRDPARGADPGGGHDGGAAPGGGRRYGGTGGDLPEAHGSGGRGGAHRGAASRAGAGMMGGASTTGGARPAVVDAGMGVLLGEIGRASWRESVTN